MYARNLFNFLKPAIDKAASSRSTGTDEVFAAVVLDARRRDPARADAPALNGGVMIDGIVALYIFMLAAFTGYEVIARVPVILHTPLMSGSNFVHGIVLVGAMVALGGAVDAARERSSASSA